VVQSVNVDEWRRPRFAWGTCLGAVGTVGAFVVGGVAISRQSKFEKETRRRQDAADHRERLREHRKYAEAVTVWQETIPGTDQRLGGRTSTVANRSVAVVLINNAGMRPIKEVSVVWTCGDGIKLTDALDVVPPVQTIARPRPPIDGDHAGEDPIVSISFRDDNGQLWQVDQSGEIAEF